MEEKSGETIMGALIGLPPRRFSDLITTVAADLRLQQHRLAFLLLSPLHFSQTLHYLHSLSFSQKVVLLARLLLRSLTKLLPSSSATSRNGLLRLRDFDAALLLITMCEVYDRDAPAGTFDWRTRIADHLLASTLSPACLGWGVVGRYADAAVKCRRLLEAFSSGGKEGHEVGASVAAVVALPSVECAAEAGKECAVCKEEMEAGRDVCEMPCRHVFHWMCILPWLRKRNTCPCCRFELPTDDVFCEIGRVWRMAVQMSVGDTRVSGEQLSAYPS